MTAGDKSLLPVLEPGMPWNRLVGRGREAPRQRVPVKAFALSWALIVITAPIKPRGTDERSRLSHVPGEHPRGPWWSRWSIVEALLEV